MSNRQLKPFRCLYNIHIYFKRQAFIVTSTFKSLFYIIKYLIGNHKPFRKMHNKLKFKDYCKFETEVLI